MSNKSATSKADTAVKLVLIFFISLLSFSVGTYVGKQVSDSDHRRAALEAEYESGTTASHDTAMDESTQPITDEEVASLTEEFVKSERHVASEDKSAEPKQEPAEKTDEGYMHVSKLNATRAEKANGNEPASTGAQDVAETKPAPSETPAQAATAKQEVKPVPGNAGERVANDMAPAPDPKKKREPSAVLPSVATSAIGKYTVQVASYASEDEAKSHAEKLKNQGYSAFFVPAEIKGRTWFRVSIGLFSDQKSATNYRGELISSQAVSSAIVQKITQ